MAHIPVGVWFGLFVVFDLLGASAALLALNLHDDWHKTSPWVTFLVCLGGLLWGIAVVCLFKGVCVAF